MNLVENTVERVFIPAGAVASVRIGSPGSTGSVALAAGSVAFTPASVSGASPAFVGPFAEPVEIAVSAAGLLVVDVGSVVAGGSGIMTGDGVVALSEPVEEVLANPTATTQILTGPGEYFHYRCTVAAGNITVYDNTASSGKVLVPTTALAVGAFPIFGAGISRSLIVSNGIRVVLSGAATVYIGRLEY